MENKPPDLDIRALAGGSVDALSATSWRLTIPAGSEGRYRLAQLDDYSHIHRRDFPWRLPLQLKLRARASAADLPGTWGFGLWNDPFITDFGFAGGVRRFPVLPETAWFFFASEENYLTLNDAIPASGALAATFRSRKIPSLVLALAVPTVPLFFIGPAARLLRNAGRQLIQQDAAEINRMSGANTFNVTLWHEYLLDIESEKACFFVNGHPVLETKVVPTGPLGLVIWIDNQYAALPPGGGITFGTLENPEPAWIEIADLHITMV